jgi:cellobiose-specific phosphotransferase system component IIA
MQQTSFHSLLLQVVKMQAKKISKEAGTKKKNYSFLIKHAKNTLEICPLLFNA